MHLKSTISALTFLACIFSNACYVPPSHFDHSPARMFVESDSIVLATAKSAKEFWEDVPEFQGFTFETTEVLKGSPPDKFEMVGFLMDGEANDLNGHKDLLFWAGLVSNSVQPGDCKAYGAFRLGSTYLIFLGGPSYPRGFENIQSADDQWLRVVKAAMDAQTGSSSD